MKNLKTRKNMHKQTKRKQTKRKQTKRIKYKRTNFYGGKFNDVETGILVKRMRENNYTEEEITSIINDLHKGAHIFSGPLFTQLLYNFDRMENKEQFKNWVKELYNPRAEHDETDSEGELSDDDY